MASPPCSSREGRDERDAFGASSGNISRLRARGRCALRRRRRRGGDRRAGRHRAASGAGSGGHATPARHGRPPTPIRRSSKPSCHSTRSLARSTVRAGVRSGAAEGNDVSPMQAQASPHGPGVGSRRRAPRRLGAAFAVDASRPVRDRGTRGVRRQLLALPRRGRPGRRPADAHCTRRSRAGTPWFRRRPSEASRSRWPGRPPPRDWTRGMRAPCSRWWPTRPAAISPAACTWNDIGGPRRCGSDATRGTNGAAPPTRLPTKPSGSGSWNTAAGGYRPRRRPKPSRRPCSTAGGWLDPSFEPGEVRDNPRARGGPSLESASQPVHGGQDESASARQSDYPLRAIAFTPAVIDRGRPESAGAVRAARPAGWVPWRVWVEMSPETAHALDIQHGTWVRVSSPHGAIEAVAVLADGAAPESVAIAHVPFMPGGGRWARTPETDVRRLWPRGRSAVGTVPANVTRG